jgi:hypothetical protein
MLSIDVEQLKKSIDAEQLVYGFYDTKWQAEDFLIFISTEKIFDSCEIQLFARNFFRGGRVKEYTMWKNNKITFNEFISCLKKSACSTFGGVVL